MRFLPSLHRYVARRNPRDSNCHHIVGIQTVKPLELAQQTSLDVGNAWGVLRAIIDTCFQQPYDPTKKLLILKDPNQVFEFHTVWQSVCHNWFPPSNADDSKALIIQT